MRSRISNFCLPRKKLGIFVCWAGYLRVFLGVLFIRLAGLSLCYLANIQAITVNVEVTVKWASVVLYLASCTAS